jgi:hypothetical protein
MHVCVTVTSSCSRFYYFTSVDIIARRLVALELSLSKLSKLDNHPPSTTPVQEDSWRTRSVAVGE